MYLDVFIHIYILRLEMFKRTAGYMHIESMADSIYTKAKRRADPGDCGAPCDGERGAPRKALSDAEMERQRRRLAKGPW
jgi:hypothetical protein